MSNKASLFEESTLRKLEQLSLVAERVRVGAMKGDRRSRKRGSSIEFADYRDYARGDDLRRLDWNVYARLERPFIKLLEEEEDLAVHLLIDASASMDWPYDEATNKLAYALRLAAALGHIALVSGDLLRVTLLTADRSRRIEGPLTAEIAGDHPVTLSPRHLVTPSCGPFRGRQNSLRLLQFLDSARAGGITDLNVSLRNYALRAGRPGLLFLLSDLLSPAGYQEGLNALQARGYEVGLIHLLSPDEVEPPLAGDVKLIDVETNQEAEISLDATTLTRYRDRLAAWQSEIAARCAKRGIHYVPITTDTAWEKLVMQTLRTRGIVE